MTKRWGDGDTGIRGDGKMERWRNDPNFECSDVQMFPYKCFLNFEFPSVFLCALSASVVKNPSHEKYPFQRILGNRRIRRFL